MIDADLNYLVFYSCPKMLETSFDSLISYGNMSVKKVIISFLFADLCVYRGEDDGVVSGGGLFEKVNERCQKILLTVKDSNDETMQ